MLTLLARRTARAVRALSHDAARGHELARAGRLAEAAGALRSATRAHDALPTHHAALGEVLLQLGEFDEAEAALRAAVRADPSLSAAQCNLGQLLGQRASELCPTPTFSADASSAAPGDTDAAATLFAEAEAAFRAAVAADARNATALCGVGTCAELRGDAKGAEEARRTCGAAAGTGTSIGTASTGMGKEGAERTGAGCASTGAAAAAGCGTAGS